MKFTIKEGEYECLTADEFVKFEEDYLHSDLTRDEVKSKYNLSKKQYADVTRSIRKKHNIMRRPKPSCKNYYRFGNQYRIIKTIDGTRYYIGSLPCHAFSEEDVLKIVEHCRKLQWNVDDCEQYIKDCIREAV